MEKEFNVLKIKHQYEFNLNGSACLTTIALVFILGKVIIDLCQMKQESRKFNKNEEV